MKFIAMMMVMLMALSGVGMMTVNDQDVCAVEPVKLLNFNSIASDMDTGLAMPRDNDTIDIYTEANGADIGYYDYALGGYPVTDIARSYKLVTMDPFHISFSVHMIVQFDENMSFEVGMLTSGGPGNFGPAMTIGPGTFDDVPQPSNKSGTQWILTQYTSAVPHTGVPGYPVLGGYLYTVPQYPEWPIFPALGELNWYEMYYNVTTGQGENIDSTLWMASWGVGVTNGVTYQDVDTYNADDFYSEGGDYYLYMQVENYANTGLDAPAVSMKYTPAVITTDDRVPNQWTDVELLKLGFPTPYPGESFIAWKNVEYGRIQEQTLPFSVSSTSAIFKPGYSEYVRMDLKLEVYDNDTLVYLYDWPMQISDNDPNHVYSFANGNVTKALDESNGTGYTNEFINLNLEFGHTYYFVYDMRVTDMAGVPLPTTTFTGVITTSSPMTNQQSWINGLIWILILFTPVWIMNWFFPRYGFLLGMALMAILLGISNPGFYYVSIIILASIGLMSYTISKGD